MRQLRGLSALESIALGIAVGLLSTSVQSVGLTLQRKSHILEDEKSPHDARRPPHRRRRWQLGMLMFIVSNLLGSTIQITTLPLPVLSTLQASGLVFNSICATLILGEPFTRWSLGGTILVCGGAVLIAVFGAIGEPAHTLDQLLTLLQRRQFVLWMAGQAVLVFAIMVGTRVFKLLNPRTTHTPRTKLARGLAYGCISGILSAHSLLVAKSAVELLVRTIIDGVNQFNRWQSWMVLLGLVALALSQLYYLHRGLKLCSTSVLYPFIFCVYNIIAILDGLIYFKQTSKLSATSALLIGVGTAVLLLGVLALSWRLHDEPAAKPPVVQTGSGRGMDGTNNDDGSRDDRMVDDESLASHERQSLLPHSNGDIRTLHKRQDQTGSATCARIRNVTEAEEIWGELEDDASASIPPSALRLASPISTIEAGHSDGNGGFGNSAANLRAKRGNVHVDQRKLSMPSPHLTGPESSGRSKLKSQRSQESPIGWWRWQWWRRRSRNEAF